MGDATVGCIYLQTDCTTAVDLGKEGGAWTLYCNSGCLYHQQQLTKHSLQTNTSKYRGVLLIFPCDMWHTVGRCARMAYTSIIAVDSRYLTHHSAKTTVNSYPMIYGKLWLPHGQVVSSLGRAHASCFFMRHGLFYTFFNIDLLWYWPRSHIMNGNNETCMSLQEGNCPPYAGMLTSKLWRQTLTLLTAGILIKPSLQASTWSWMHWVERAIFAGSHVLHAKNSMLQQQQARSEHSLSRKVRILELMVTRPASLLCSYEKI